MAEKMGLYQFGPAGLAQQIIDEQPRVVHPRPGRDQPARPGQRLLDAGGRRHPVRRHPGDGGPRPARAAADGRRRRSRWRPATSARPRRSRPASRTRSTRCCARTSSRATAARPRRRAYVPGHQIAGKTGTDAEQLCRWPSSATRPEITASVMVFNPKVNQNVGGFGGGKGATVWHDAMAPILEARGSSDFPPADPKVVNGNTKPVPGCSTVSQCRSVLSAAGFQTATGAGRQRQEGRRAGRHQPAARRPGRPGPARDDPDQQRLGLHRTRARAAGAAAGDRPTRRPDDRRSAGRPARRPGPAGSAAGRPARTRPPGAPRPDAAWPPDG